MNICVRASGACTVNDRVIGGFGVATIFQARRYALLGSVAAVVISIFFFGHVRSPLVGPLALRARKAGHSSVWCAVLTLTA
jgi:hypothetical protein